MPKVCPNHPDLDQEFRSLLPIPGEEPAQEYSTCGCWVRPGESLNRHCFRFFPGDQVRHGRWRGFTGTVNTVREGSLTVDWNPIPGLGANITPSYFASNFEVRHLEEAGSDA